MQQWNNKSVICAFWFCNDITSLWVISLWPQEIFSPLYYTLRQCPTLTTSTSKHACMHVEIEPKPMPNNHPAKQSIPTPCLSVHPSWCAVYEDRLPGDDTLLPAPDCLPSLFSASRLTAALRCCMLLLFFSCVFLEFKSLTNICFYVYFLR